MTRTTATTRHGAALIALACVLASALVWAGAAQARLGDLDPSFAGDGIANVNAPGSFQAVATRSGGGAVAAGWGANGQQQAQAFVTQLHSDGQPDPAFGTAGVVALPPVSHAYGVALDGSQRVLVAGARQIPGVAGEIPTVWRIGPAGTAAFDIAGLPGEAHAVIPLDDGRMLVGGWRQSTAQSQVFFVARLDELGRPDATFAGDGVAEADFGVPARALAMTVDPAGRILLAGHAGAQSALARFDATGLPDKALDVDGEVTFGTGELHAVQVDGAGRIAAAGRSGSQALVVRRLDDGSADPGFGMGGETTRPNAALGGLLLDGTRAVVAGTSNRELLLGSLDGAGAPEPALAWRSFPGAVEASGAAVGPGATVYTAGGPAPFVSRHLPNAAPAAVLNGPAQVVAGAPAAFDAGGSSDPEGEALRFEFDLDGDGAYEFDGGGNALAIRSFPAPGAYTVGVRVTDPRGGSATATRAVTVVAAGRPVPQPVLGEQGVARPLSGIVRIRLPGTRRFVRLTELAAIPNGTEIDARKGRVFISVLRNASGRLDGARFFKGRFFFRQGEGPKPITRLKLSGGSFANCTVRAAQGSSLATIASVKGGTGTRKKRRVRKLWGDGRGRFRTRGRYGAATVRGTRWLTLDRCDGTKVRVVEGKVAVKSLARPNRPAKMVRAGQSTLVRFGR